MDIHQIEGGVCAAQGFKAYGMHAGFRLNKARLDLALVYSDTICSVGAAYTRNKVFGAPILLNREYLRNGKAQAVVINSGNANTCNADGYEKAKAMSEIVACELGIAKEDMLVASTGVIGKPLDISPLIENVATLVDNLSTTGGSSAAQAIMTTDTVSKQIAYSFDIDGVEYHIGGMAKGSGMIEPNMATMLAFITCDIAISHEVLQSAVSEVITDTFNMVSVDGDTSTNDMVCVFANGKAGGASIQKNTYGYEVFYKALYAVCSGLGRMLARDGEGATKLVECIVSGALDKSTAKIVAKTIIRSSLVKTAMFGADANWGRILCAIGYSNAEVDVSRVKVVLSSCGGDVLVCENGAGVEFSEELAKQILIQNEIVIQVSLGDGDGCASAWGCDLSYEYVRINGDYRT